MRLYFSPQTLVFVFIEIRIEIEIFLGYIIFSHIIMVLLILFLSSHFNMYSAVQPDKSTVQINIFKILIMYLNSLPHFAEPGIPKRRQKPLPCLFPTPPPSSHTLTPNYAGYLNPFNFNVSNKSGGRYSYEISLLYNPLSTVLQSNTYFSKNLVFTISGFNLI